MENFRDFYGSEVRLNFGKGAFSKSAKHVLVLCEYKAQWLLTRHQVRGLEFPGGKVEKGETLEEAARREVFEETGALLDSLEWIGEYEVAGEEETFVKAIFYGKVKELKKNSHYHETEGPVLVSGDLLEKRYGEDYSFIMKDQVVEKSILYIEKKKSGKS